MKKKINVILAALLCVVLLAGCSAPKSNDAPKDGSTTESTSGGELKKIKVGTMPTTIGVPLQYAYEQGYFSDLGLDVEIVLFPQGAPINEALAAKQIDAAASGLASVFALSNDLATWVAEGNTTGGMGIYVREDSKLLEKQGEIDGKPDMYGDADLIKDLQILGPLGTAAQFNSIRYAQQFGLIDTDIEQVHMEYGPALQAFKAGEGDAIASCPPFSYDAKASGFILAASFEDATEAPLRDGIIVRKDLADSKREEFKLLVEGYYKACQDFMDDPQLRFDYSMKWFTDNGREYTKEDLELEIEDRDYITKDFMLKDDYIYGKGMVEIGRFFAQDGKITEDSLPNIPNNFDTSIIKDIMDIEFEVAE